MRKSVISILLYLIFYSILFGQREASNWYFGNKAGIRFNTDGSVTELTDGQLSTIEGCSTISDSNGNLIFYTDGITVWNKNHNPMPNASAALGNGLYGNPSSSQSALIVPQPNNPYIFYIFTIDTVHLTDNLPDQGFNYSIVDMRLNEGLGDVTTKNKNLLRDSSEKITAVTKNCAEGSIWVITYAAPDGSPETPFNTFHAYEVNSSGLVTTPVSSTFNTNVQAPIGYLKLSPDGTKLASANAASGLYLYDFDKSTGIVSNEKRINISFSRNGTKPQAPYGLEFSQNNELLYVTSYYMTNKGIFDDNPEDQYGALLQYNLNTPNISRSEIVIDSMQTYRSSLQLGPNGKIYRTMSKTYDEGLPYLSTINNPNKVGKACNYEHKAITLSRNSRQGLPPFITSFFSEKIDIIRNGISTTKLNLCQGDTYTLSADDIPGATYTWTFNGEVILSNNMTLFSSSSNNNSNSTNAFEYYVNQTGLYEVFIDPNTGNCDGLLEGLAYVDYKNEPTANKYTLIQCDEDGLYGGTTRFNLNEASDFLTNDISGISVKFYEDPLRNNEITNPDDYNYNVDMPHPIYVEVINDSTGCKKNTELILNVSTTQTNNIDITPVCDDIESEDGMSSFNLTAIESKIKDLNNHKGTTITFFETLNDALLEQNYLETPYTNTSAYSQTIYARTENINNCYSISEVSLTVNKLPELEAEETTYYCINSFPETISINAGIINDSSDQYTYKWSTGEITNDITINEPGTYDVTVTNANGCSKKRKVIVEPSNIATIKDIIIKDARQDNSITIITSGEGEYQYMLIDENGDTHDNDYQTDNTFTDIPSGIYTVKVKDLKNNCGTSYRKLSVIGFPKFLTPNGDGINDTWQIQGVSSMFQANSKVHIFNRFGKLITKLNPLGEGWDGSHNGIKLPKDDYWFSVILEDGRLFKSHFTLTY